MNRAVKAIILARVSSKDQEEGYSLEVQTERLETYCNRKDLHIVKRFSFVESSTKGDRKKFSEIIKFIKQSKEPIALVADKVDRIQRSQKETPIFDQLLKKGKLELHFNSEGYVIHQESSAHEHMIWGTGVVFARFYTDLLSENVKKSLKQKVQIHNEWYGNAPIGYLNKRDDRNRAIIIADPVRAPIITRIFDEYSTGAYTIPEMAKKANEWGLLSKKGNRMTQSVIHRMLMNPIYYGEMRVKGELWPHCYETITTREIFKACEAVRLGWDKKPFKYGGKEFVFRGILKCATTGNTVTADTKKKKYPSGKVSEWTYLRCWNPENPEKKMYVREDDILEQLNEVLLNLGIKDQTILNNVLEFLMGVNSNKKQHHNRELGALRQEHSDIQNRLDALIDLVADGTLTRNEFLRKKESLKERQYDVSLLISSYDRTDDQFSKKLVNLIHIATHAHETFNGSTIEEKRELLNFIFANLKLNGRKLEYTLNFPFSEFAKVNNDPTWRRERDSNPR